MALAFLAKNQVFENFFDTLDVEAAEPQDIHTLKESIPFIFKEVFFDSDNPNWVIQHRPWSLPLGSHGAAKRNDADT